MDNSVGIIGYGRFGKVLADMLKSDFQVRVCARHNLKGEVPPDIQAATLEETLACGTLFYAVPISTFAEVLSSHISFFERERKPKVVIDVLSVKLHAKKIMEAYLPPHVRGLLTHPMFGPDSIRISGLAGLPMVLDRFTLDQEQYTFWKNFFCAKGLHVIEMTAEEHDRLAAYSQGLAHFIGRVLDELQITSTPIDTLGAKKLLELREQTCNDTWQLFTDLQTKNPYTLEMRVKLGKAVDHVYNRLLPNRIDQQQLVVGIQGGKGSFNEAAALYYLKRADVTDYRLVYLYTSEAVLRALHEGRVDRGQFAIHNSVGGVVDESIEALARYKIRIIEQFSIKISHALMIRTDANLARVDTIMSHPQVFKQCKNTLAEKYGRLKLISGSGDLVDAAKVAEELGAKRLPTNVATMGSARLAEIYGLKIVEDNLQDLQENYTSFLWMERP